MEKNYYTVAAVNAIIKDKLENDFQLRGIQVVGEISNFKHHQTGHLYFSLKDENSKINAVMFKSYAYKVKFTLEDGMRVVVNADIGVYIGTGAYQLYVKDIEPLGVGALYLEYERLKKQLEEEGLFDENRKKAIPKFPKSIGVISAKEGAAIRDVITTIKRRWPIAKITLLPSLVQGKSAARSVVENLRKADSMGFDTVIVARGGGSIEDLFAFNEEIVARAVDLMKTPVISAIGHETDFTIIDFVADKRAATPTAAAELATPNINEIRGLMMQTKARLQNAMASFLNDKRNTLYVLANNTYLTKPERFYADKGMKLNMLEQRLVSVKEKLFIQTRYEINNDKKRLERSLESLLIKDKNQLGELIAKLSSLNPLNVLKRGYGMVSKEENIITSINQVEEKDKLTITLADGKIKTIVETKEAK